MTEYLNLELVLLLAIGFTCASLFGYLATCLKLEPLIGYLFAGYICGPYSPGITLDVKIAEQLAEIGVILMMFSVGMLFTWEDLAKVKKITVPGAILQTLVATCLGSALFASTGQSLSSGVLFGLSLGVASMVVLVRGLTDSRLLDTTEGHLSVGWLMIEDKIAVACLVLLPTFAAAEQSPKLVVPLLLGSFALTFLKFALLVVLLLTVGRWFARLSLEKIKSTGSQELFTITVLALAFLFAEVANKVFGVSIIIGAFLAGIVIGQTSVRRVVADTIRPIKDAFIVLFFLAIGMLFDPGALVGHFTLFVGTLAIILLAKPTAAYLIAKMLKRSNIEALTVAVGLAQIGELSFVLAEEGMRFDLLPDLGYDVLVACAIVSISLNPFLFKRIATKVG